MYKLVISDDEGKTTVVPLIRDEVTIGRREGNTIRLTDRNVSRSHARLVRDEKGAFVLNDQKSRNGTKVNGDLVGTKSRRIKPSDQITIGDYSLSIRTDVADGVPMGRQMDPGESAGIGKVTSHARLVMLTAPEPGREIDLTVNLYVVGRSEEANLRIEDPSISRAHARMDGENHQWTISDLDSINGVTINGAKRDDYVLKSGDVVELGTVRLKYVAPGEPYDYNPGGVAGAQPPPAARRSRLLPILAAVALLAVAAIVLIAFFLTRPADDGIEEISPDDEPGSLGFEELIERGKDKMQAEEWAEAARYFARASTVSPDSTVARDLKRLAQSEMEAQAAHQAGTAALAAFDWREAMDQLAAIPRSSRYSDRALLDRAVSKVCEELLATSRLAARGGDQAGAEAALQQIESLPALPANCSGERDALQQELRRRRAGAGDGDKGNVLKPIEANPYDTKTKKPAVDNPYATDSTAAKGEGKAAGPAATGSQVLDAEKPPASGPGSSAISWDPVGEARKALDSGDTAGAIRILERGGNGRPVLSMLAKLYLQQGNQAGYERVARKFIKLYPSDPKSEKFKKSLGI
ncbi:MAG TPA: FHA domain-containing protein [Polyangia bacterium]|nr:FHA domain-containing protein [Polyangia bacterium]